jgi:hypothetical protein
MDVLVPKIKFKSTFIIYIYWSESKPKNQQQDIFQNSLENCLVRAA